MTVCEKLALLDKTLWPLFPRGAKYELAVNAQGMVVVRLTVHAVLPDGRDQLRCLVHQQKLLDKMQSSKAIVAYGNKVCRDFARELKGK